MTDKGAWCAAVHGVANRHELVTEQEQKQFFKKVQMTLFTNRNTYINQKQTESYQRGNIVGRDKSESWNELGKTVVCIPEERYLFPAQELNLGSLDENQQS